MTLPQHSSAKPAPRSPRRLAGAAAATGLLLALAAPALTGTAYADGHGVKPKHPAAAVVAAPNAQPKSATPAAEEPSAAPSSPVKRAGKGAQATEPQAERPAATGPAAAPPRSGVEPSAAPNPPGAAPADQKELAHTGSSTATTVMGVGAGALILAGVGAVYAVRRRHQN
ncbi:LPXTG cell wall anchor domain-containing protein [Streptomyces sp. NPDC048416]|uniref:LPXTG cell wall anchor domain-containing protein n=1 Tax=Streptomyces sp. NPDC048416 TaxID=3365546 RepID=UPI00371FF1D6